MSALKGSASLQRLRRRIDRIDRRLVPLLAARGDLVRAVAGVKASPRAVRAPRRAAQVIAKVRGVARRHRMDPDLAARIYRGMIAAFLPADAQAPPKVKLGILKLTSSAVLFLGVEKGYFKEFGVEPELVYFQPSERP